MTALRIGLLASHGGSNLQAILDACRSGAIAADPVVVISNNSQSRAMERARLAGVPTVHLSSQTHPDPAKLDVAILEALVAHGVQIVVLAGYMRKLGAQTTGHFRNRILNVHPSLLPAHGGKGMYGMRVHEAVLAAGDRETGATIHVVNEAYDDGAILAQRAVPVLPQDDAEAVASRVLSIEHALYVDTLRRIAAGELELPPANASAAVTRQ